MKIYFKLFRLTLLISIQPKCTGKDLKYNRKIKIPVRIGECYRTISYPFKIQSNICHFIYYIFFEIFLFRIIFQFPKPLQEIDKGFFLCPGCTYSESLVTFLVSSLLLLAQTHTHKTYCLHQNRQYFQTIRRTRKYSKNFESFLVLQLVDGGNISI